MKNFYKANRKAFSKLLANRIGAIIFSLMIVLLIVNSQNPLIDIGVSLISILFFCYLIYLSIWEFGASDRIRVDGGRLESCPHNGLKIGLISAIPGFVFAFLVFIGTALEALGVSFFGGVASVGEVAARIWQAMYIPIIQVVTPAKEVITAGERVLCSLLYFAVIIPEVLAVWAAYYLGYQGKLMSRFYKKGDKE